MLTVAQHSDEAKVYLLTLLMFTAAYLKLFACYHVTRLDWKVEKSKIGNVLQSMLWHILDKMLLINDVNCKVFRI